MVSQGECLRQHSADTFQRLWQAISFWQCYFWVNDGNPVYPIFIPDGDQIVSKTYRTRVEGENTRLRHLFKSCAVTLPTPINSMTIREKQKDRILRKRGRYSRKDNNRFMGYSYDGQFPLYDN